MYSLRVKFIIKIRLKIWRQFNKFCPSCINLKFMAYHHSVPLVQQVLPCRRCLPVQSFCQLISRILIRLLSIMKNIFKAYHLYFLIFISCKLEIQNIYADELKSSKQSLKNSHAPKNYWHFAHLKFVQSYKC